MSKFKIRDLIFFCIGCIIGCLVASIFSLCNNDAGASTIIISPAKIQKQAEYTEKAFQQEIQTLHNKNLKLDSALRLQNSALVKAKNKVLVLQTQVKSLIGFDNSSANEIIDSSQMINDCVELKTRVGELITESNVKDSINDVVDANLEMQVKNKDSTILLQQWQYKELKHSFEQSIQQQQFLTSENKLLRRKIKRKIFGNRLLNIGVIVLSVITAKSLIH